MPTKETRAPLLWSLLLIVIGVVWLLDSFLLLGDFNPLGLLPLVLVIAGAQILLGGDIQLITKTHSFFLTRGSVQSGTIEVSAADIDVEIRPLQREGRLIAGQFAVPRPQFKFTELEAQLRFMRADTPWYAFGDWQIALAQDLPWQLFITSHLGQLNLDLSDVIIQDAVIATGLGDIRLVAPREALAPIYVQTALGVCTLITPPGYATRITVNAGRMVTLKVNETRYLTEATGVYRSVDVDQGDWPIVEIVLTATFGDVYLT
ncbi:MAG: hypothetical protein MUF87_15590 [Anaerolineae bacterium]|jgi:hypothetical protein|nr:hypothetical protein [Anaerolineae bacterium]